MWWCLSGGLTWTVCWRVFQGSTQSFGDHCHLRLSRSGLVTSVLSSLRSHGRLPFRTVSSPNNITRQYLTYKLHSSAQKMLSNSGSHSNLPVNVPHAGVKSYRLAGCFVTRRSVQAIGWCGRYIVWRPTHKARCSGRPDWSGRAARTNAAAGQLRWSRWRGLAWLVAWSPYGVIDDLQGMLDGLTWSA